MVDWGYDLKNAKGPPFCFHIKENMTEKNMNIKQFSGAGGGTYERQNQEKIHKNKQKKPGFKET